ncbi:MAG: flap endonuclease-1 [Candidatus Aenigmarchaeota archaeon]|nr:flap endonuclease-1 [Candidatus Aenigmarchaeota archaeon]
MGVSLSGLVSAKELSLEDLNGKRIAIDANNTLYQFLSTIRDRLTGESLRDSNGEITSHLSGLFYRTSRLMESGIEPIYVFDGKPPEFKRETVQARMKIRAEAKRKWEEAVEKGEIEKVKMYAQGAARLTEDMSHEAKVLLDYMGVPWIQAPSEGEAEAACLAKKGRAWAAGSQDWDSLLFGAPKLVRNLTITGRRKVARKEKYIVVNPELVELNSVLSELGVTHEQLILVGILVGTDFNMGGVKGFGPKKALAMVKEKKTLERVMKEISWEFRTSPEQILDFFKNPPSCGHDIPKAHFQPEKVRELMCEKHGFSKERIDSVLEKMGKFSEKKKQAGLGSFFGK